VKSGVSQRTALGPLLFLIHINDLPQDVSSQIHLFADNCLLYHSVKSTEDQLALQEDLIRLQELGEKWSTKFNASICTNILRITRSKQPISTMYRYTLCGHTLEQVNETKYFGINF